jgi:hypothetical protein
MEHARLRLDGWILAAGMAACFISIAPADAASRTRAARAPVASLNLDAVNDPMSPKS